MLMNEESGGKTSEELAPHHVSIRERFPLFRALKRSIVAPAPPPTPKKKGPFVAVTGTIGGRSVVEDFEIHRTSPLVFKIVRVMIEQEWIVTPSVLSQAIDMAKQGGSEWAEVPVTGVQKLMLRHKQLRAGLAYLLSLK